MRCSMTILLFLTLAPTFGQSKKLQQKRFDILINKYLVQTFDRETLQTIISPVDTNITINSAYQVILNDDKTKFVAFFLEQFDPNNFKIFRDGNKDKRVNIVTTTDIMKGGNFDDLNTYAYIVYGVKSNNKWYYEKTDITYFAAKTLHQGQQVFFNHLQGWNFFKTNSTRFNPDFWETVLFEKVSENLSNDPHWSSYIGLYSVVANQMRKEKKELANKNELEIINKYIHPLTDKLKIQNNYESVSTKQMSKDFLLIYPSELTAILCPINVKEKDKETYIRYFVLLPQGTNYKIYEWTYLNPSNFINSRHGPSFIDQINTLTTWNYSFDKLDDSNFWNEYVLLKSGDEYKYLNEVK